MAGTAYTGASYASETNTIDTAGTVSNDNASNDTASGNSSADSAEYGRLGEVVVSARRREENAQDVPIPIAAVSGADLAQANQFRLEDLNQRLPSTNIAFANPRQSSIAVRGLGNNPANDALESSVGVYLDNVYLGRSSMANIDLLDIDQIALLRGPQGTLFGKNTTGGVLNITTALPSFKPSAEAEASVGNYDYYQLRATATGPLIDDTLAGRLTATRTYRDGYVDNVVNGKNYDGESRWALRGQLLWQPSDALSVRFIAEHEEEHSDTGTSALFSLGPNGGLKYRNALAAAGALPPIYDPDYQTAQFDGSQHMVVRQTATSAEANYSLGDYKITSITAWRSWGFLPYNDADGTNLDALPNAGQEVHDNQFSEELRIASPGDRPLSWVAGLYYFWQQQHNQTFFFYGNNARAIGALGLGAPGWANGYYQTPQYLRTESGAAFAQLTYRPTSSWEFTAGIRDTQEGKAMRVTRSSTGPAAFTAVYSPYDSGLQTLNNNSVSALLSASYKITPGIMTYASLSRGAKAGGINPAVPSAALGVKSLYVGPETAEDAEFGFKTSWLNQRITANVDVFWTEVKDYQANLQEPVSATNTFLTVLTNVGRVRTRGVETEVNASLSDGLTARFTGSYDNATYLRYNNAPCPVEALFPTNASPGAFSCSLTGRPLVGAPTWILNPGLTETHYLFAGLKGLAEVDWAWRSKQYGSADDSQFAQIPSYGVFNLHAGVQGSLGADRTWTATLWSNNIFDKHYVTGGLTTASALYYYSLTPGLPRTYGLTLNAHL
jgi:iron complex outermembrane recepter protein